MTSSGAESWGPPFLIVCQLALAALVVGIAWASARGNVPRNPATADRWEMRSPIWASEETWVAAHRAQAPLLTIGAAGLVVAAVVGIVVSLSDGGAAALPVTLTATAVALGWLVLWCTVAGVVGRVVAKRIIARSPGRADG